MLFVEGPTATETWCVMTRRSARMQREQAIRHGVLGLLTEEPGHAYDVMKRLKTVWGPAADVKPSSVYSALHYHERDGNAVAVDDEQGREDEESTRGPTFHITPKGVAQWEDWLRAPSQPEKMRGEFALKMALSRPEHALPLLMVIDDYERQVLARLAKNSAALDDLLEARPDAGTGPRALAYARATRYLDAELEWIREDVRPAVEEARERALQTPRPRGGGRGGA